MPHIVESTIAVGIVGYIGFVSYLFMQIIQNVSRDAEVWRKSHQNEVLVPETSIDDVIFGDEITRRLVNVNLQVYELLDHQDEREELKISVVKGNLKINEKVIALEGCTVIVDKDK